MSEIHLLLTGDELMSGDTVDSNSAMIAQKLSEDGLEIIRKVTLGDNQKQLKAGILEAIGVAKVLIVNGGLGPTQDDLTSQMLAEAAGCELVNNPEADRHVRSWCAERNIQANSANLKQALIPDKAETIHNPVGSALGFALIAKNTLIIATPGVPRELRAMLDDVCKRIVCAIGSRMIHRKSFQTFGIGESTVQGLIDAESELWPEDVVLGFRAGMPQLEIKLTAKSNTESFKTCEEILQRNFGDHILGPENTTLPGSLQSALREAGKKMVSAESCTGGLIGAMMTSQPGSSAVFEAGFITYANHIKQSVLGVKAETIELYGAVSESVVKEMLKGALSLSGADIGIAVSGIAGPDGATPEKPVGSVWLAWGNRDSIKTHSTVIKAERGIFQSLVAAAGVDLLRREILRLESLCHYLRQD